MVQHQIMSRYHRTSTVLVLKLQSLLNATMPLPKPAFPQMEAMPMFAELIPAVQLKTCDDTAKFVQVCGLLEASLKCDSSHLAMSAILPSPTS